MKKGWEIKTLGEVCDKASSNIAQNKLNDNEGIYPIYGASGFIKNIDFYQQENEYIAIVKDGSGVGRVTLYPEKSSVLGTLQYIIPNEKVTTRYIYYFLNSIDFDKYKCGAAIPHIYFKDYSNESIPIPPIKEQEEIVDRLDKGFELIDSLKETAKKNLDNAKELFQSVLREELSPKEGWETKTLENCFKLKSGNNLTSKDMIIEGSYPVYGGNGIAGYYNDYNLEGENIIVGRVGALCGNVRQINEKIWLTDNAFKITDYMFDYNLSYLTYLLNYINLRGFARQAAQPVISNNSLKDVLICFPKSIKEQEDIVNRLDRIKGYCEELEGNYKRVLELCEELKQGLLREAFEVR